MASDEMLRFLDNTEVVAVVTTRRDGRRAATPIWSMVVDGVAYVRSAYGPSAWWYRHVLSGRPVAFATESGKIAESDRDAALELPRTAVAMQPVPANDAVHAAIDAEIERKYEGAMRSSIDAMLSPEATACTLRVVSP
ncbi:DUF2255 family protein [Microbacterium amylolyticum]|uniref:DUF2255 family protein n=1 Tax=Microbacterium amylolyticum TaxID=936337 RepID=A0ABS4ZHB9_9MICO|nr:DUF2255 family protein [Microbacterium amylolyticum]MBP2436403.1 hypothetical protein [Microbacterium amylolyticum]